MHSSGPTAAPTFAAQPSSPRLAGIQRRRRQAVLRVAAVASVVGCLGLVHRGGLFAGDDASNSLYGLLPSALHSQSGSIGGGSGRGMRAQSISVNGAPAAHRRQQQKPLGSVPDAEAISGIKPRYRSRPFGMHFIHSHTADICTLPAADASPASDQLPMSPSAFALPVMRCPLAASAAPACASGGSSSGRDGAGYGADTSVVPRVLWDGIAVVGTATPSPTTAAQGAAGWGNPSLLNPLNRGRIAMKAVKYAVAHIGCDQLLEVRPIGPEYDAIRRAAAEEHGSDLQLLVLGGAFARAADDHELEEWEGGDGGGGRGAAGAPHRSSPTIPKPSSQYYHIESNVVLDVLTAAMNAADHAAPPRVGLLTLVDSSALGTNAVGGGDDGVSLSLLCGGGIGGRRGDGNGSIPILSPRLTRRLSALPYQPSSATLCAYRSVSADGTASSSAVSEGQRSDREPAVPIPTLLESLAFIPSHTFNAVLAFDGLLAAVPPPLLCAAVRELLRVTKIGGSVWVGHEADPARVRALSECRAAAGGPACDARSEGKGGEANPSLAASLTVLKEPYWFRYVISPSEAMMGAGGRTPPPHSFVWRKTAAEEGSGGGRRGGSRGGGGGGGGGSGGGPRKLGSINLNL